MDAYAKYTLYNAWICFIMQVSRAAVNVGSGVVKMSWRNGNNDSELLVATLDGLIRLVDVRTAKVLADCSGHTEAILDFTQDK